MAENTIRGTCRLMCPDKERRMREKEGLLHRFEVDGRSGSKDTRQLRADPTKTVKCFARPAAGRTTMSDPDQLRPAPVLFSTIKYLFSKIAVRTDTDWLIVYDFVFDRLRAVRQDIVVQRIGPADGSVSLFELIVRFLVYAAQRLCERKIFEYDPKINDHHLTECIKHLLVLYDELEKTQASSDKQVPIPSKNREQMEALYILIHIGDIDALHRGLNLPRYLKHAKQIRMAIKISLAWYLNNYARTCSLIDRLPPILTCAALIRIRALRRTALKIMSVAYNSKGLAYPGLKLQALLLYRDITKVRADCELFGLKLTNENILFQKAGFNDDVDLASPEMHYDARTLQEFLPGILLEST